MDQIKKLKITDQNYPQLLKKIEEPPKTLYLRRKIPQGNCFAIVGTRRCSDYGKQIALEIAGDLAKAGLVIVSGLARGIDSFAHQGCLEKNGKTIAVLGTGLDEKSIYPKENLKLVREIINKRGCLISEFPPGTPGFKQNFPQRNRIISGLCLGILVIEAKTRSGALITANWAKLQKRKIFAVPGPIYSLNSKGPNLLIKNGAILVEQANDILKALGLKPKSKQEIKGGTPKENLIREALKEKSLHIQKIIEKTGLPAKEVCSILAIMEIKNLVRNLGGNIYALKR